MSILTDAFELTASISGSFQPTMNAQVNEVDFNVAQVPYKAAITGQSLQGMEAGITPTPESAPNMKVSLNEMNVAPGALSPPEGSDMQVSYLNQALEANDPQYVMKPGGFA